MIAALLLRLGVPVLGAKIAACALLLAALAGWHVHAVHAARAAGAAEVTAQRNAIDTKNTARAQAELLAANERLRAAQANLATAQSELQRLSEENIREKLASTQRQSDLLAGRERMSVRTAGPACNPAQAGPVAGAAAASVDQGTGIEVDLDGTVAAGLEGVRAQHNDAVARLGACIAAYDAVKAAADAP